MPKERVNRLIAVFDSNGEVIFEASLHQLVRLASLSVQFSNGLHYLGPRWFRQARLADDVSVAVVLDDYNELRLSLDDLELTYVKVPDEHFGVAWLEGGRMSGGTITMLRPRGLLGPPP